MPHLGVNGSLTPTFQDGAVNDAVKEFFAF